ncbi:hypothetical protein HPB52_006394 [Rhipicephalus sanguineus]|uniref:Uncharacterized protein n=1 Tax=Rhipicephalus sanguineus TaxID=34632 RepID=A0A9D4PYR7_RHISA|nr:hypothetical protein HPB52_006394 [Rhipicephalus sanguineus]
MGMEDCHVEKCGSTLRTPSSTTSPLVNHLRSKHHMQYLELQKLTKEKPKPKEKSQQTLLDLTKAKGALSESAKKETTIFIARMIARDLQPYEFVENKGFQDLIRHLQPQYKIPHRTTFSRTVIPELYRRTVDSLKTQIASDITKGLESLAFTTDMCTSRANQGYISLTYHYMTQDFAVKAFTLACCYLQESHTAVNIQACLTEIVKEWSLDLGTVPVYVVTDNGRNIRAAVRQMEWIPLQCLGHTLQLAIKDAKEETPVVSSLCKKARALVGHYKHSAQATRRLKDCQKRMELPSIGLTQDVDTHWNSEHAMLSRLQYLQKEQRKRKRCSHIRTSSTPPVCREVCAQRLAKPLLSLHEYPIHRKAFAMVAGLALAKMHSPRERRGAVHCGGVYPLAFVNALPGVPVQNVGLCSLFRKSPSTHAPHRHRYQRCKEKMAAPTEDDSMGSTARSLDSDQVHVAKCLEEFESCTKKPETFLEVQLEVAETMKRLTKDLYDVMDQWKGKTVSSSKTELPSLVVDNFDDEQIWQQLELRNTRLVKDLISSVSRVATKSSISFGVDLGKQESQQRPEKHYPGEIDKLDLADVAAEEEDDEDDDFDLSDASEGDEDSEEEADDDGADGSEQGQARDTQPSSIVDDAFFRLADMEAFADREEKVANAPGSDSDEDDDIDYFRELSSDEDDPEEKGGRNATYNDFFDPPASMPDSKNAKNADKAATRTNGHRDTNQNSTAKDDVQKSSFEQSQEFIKKKIKQFEERNLEPRPWRLQGEVEATARPENSLLQEHIQFDHATRQPVAITDETTKCLEDVYSRGYVTRPGMTWNERLDQRKEPLSYADVSHLTKRKASSA